MSVTYGVGGFRPAHPSEGMVERRTIADGFTRWDDAGNVVEQRPLTDAETAAETAPAAPASADERLADIAAALADAPTTIVTLGDVQVIADVLQTVKTIAGES